MRTTFPAAAESYLRSKLLSRGTRNEYRSTLRKWGQWDRGVPIQRLQRGHVREFLDWVYERAVADQGTNPGRTANKAREHLRAVLSWAWEQELIDVPPRFPKPPFPAGRRRSPLLDQGGTQRPLLRDPSDAAAEGMGRPVPRRTILAGRARPVLQLRCRHRDRLEVHPAHEPILWRHVSWGHQSPDREVKETCRWGWLFYRRVKTGKSFYRPMNRVLHAHIRSLLPSNPHPDEPVFLGGGARPNARFQILCELAGIAPRTNVETGRPELCELKDLRKTCATYYDAHVPESSIEILGHSVGGITYRHYAHRAPLAFKAIMTIPQPMAFSSPVRGFDGECPCCRRRFPDAA